MNYGKNKYIIERFNLGVDKRLKSICQNNIEPLIESEMQSKENAFKKYGMTNWLLYKSYGDDFEDFVELISVLAKEYTKKHFKKEVKGKFFVSELWGIVSEPDGLATPHNHWPGVFTFVYHLELPKDNPPLVFTDSDLKLYPKEGELIFFPSWMKHEVPKNLTDGNRICLAGNVYYNEQTIR
tara:strand:- start:1263 stop:1808 length:546 start_codon:yes stop_codon:yes gene_type:complete